MFNVFAKGAVMYPGYPIGALYNIGEGDLEDILNDALNGGAGVEGTPYFAGNPYMVSGDPLTNFLVGAGWYDIGAAMPQTFMRPPARPAQVRVPVQARHPVARVPYPVPNPAMQQALLQAIAARQVQQGAIVKERQPDDAQWHYMPFTQTIVANATTPITNRPQKVAFKPKRLVVSPSTAGAFKLVSASIGIMPQFVANGAVRCDLFPPDAVLMTFDWDTAQTSMDVTLNIQNLTGVDTEFSGVLTGPTVM